jgi:hypothetical protein
LVGIFKKIHVEKSRVTHYDAMHNEEPFSSKPKEIPMKYLLIALSLCLSTQAFAGAYSLYCANADKTFVINHRVGVQITQSNGAKVEGIYFSEDFDLLGHELQDFLQDTRNKIFVDRPHLIDNRGNDIKVTSRRDYKDECGNVGEKVKFRALFRALDMQGNEIKAPTLLKCESSMIPGHCI